jgi:DNA polymerase III alpha subunit
VGSGPIETILSGRKEKKYESIDDIIERTSGDVINKKTLEALIYSGAMDRYGERASLIASVPSMSAFLKEKEAKKETSQIGMFDLGLDI